MSQQSSLHRVLEILNRLNKGEELCVSHLAEHYEVSERSIQRDFKMIIEIFDDFLIKDGECYKGLEKFLMQDLLEASDLMMLAHILHLFNIANKTPLINTKINTLIKNAEKVYAFKAKALETIEDKILVKALEHAIRYNKELKVHYHGRQQESIIILRPYKILLLNQNFYLLGKNMLNQNLNKLRVTLIKNIDYTSKTFHKDIRIEHFIQAMQTPWSEFDSKDIIVRIKANKKLSKYFKLKKYLPSQTIIKVFDNQEMEIEYKISSLREIEGLIIKWLPDITILQPIELNIKVKEKLLYKIGGL
ncbi:MAG TPA: WYL domain-containing protein [Flavobacteriaceae bacterium]|nr:WYL domain-containing protein [Flavobacteriaceae bacterium]